MKIIEIENKTIKNKVYSNLRKDFSEQLTDEELKKIKSITLNAKDSNEKKISYNVYDYKCLENIETITLNGFTIDDEMINNLNYLKCLNTIIFNHCIFENENTISTEIENVLITYCKIKENNLFEKSQNIKTLELIEVGEIDIKDIVDMENVIELSIYNSKIKNAIIINNFANLKKLRLDGSLADTLDFENKLNKNIDFSYETKFYLES